MQTISLGPSGRTTTRLGFGCSSVMGVMNRRDSLRMLDAAWDAGIRHYDVAPSYGFGEAEGCLGEFLRRHAGEATVTTKFGIPPAEASSFWSAARQLARPMIKAMPGLKAKLKGAASAAGGAKPARPAFDAASAKASLDRSLAALKVERLDVFLLHEAEAGDLTHQDLHLFLEVQQATGKIGAFGVGSEAGKIPPLEHVRPEYCPVLQYDWSVLDPLISPTESFRMHHRSLTENFTALREALADDPARTRRWSDHCDADLGNAKVLAGLMLKASLVCNPESVILFSSKHSKHVFNNVAVAEDVTAEARALRLYALTRSEVADQTVAETGVVT